MRCPPQALVCTLDLQLVELLLKVLKPLGGAAWKEKEGPLGVGLEVAWPGPTD